MKRIATIQDISCFGKCSLTVALPIISAMGVEAAIVPTAVLSTHTGGFSGFTFRDLSEDIPKIFNHWNSENIDFDAIYTGYLGSFSQIDLMKEIIDKKQENTLAFVDPAMADNGKLYTGFTPEFAHHMATLCAKADVIVPNITEACFMLDKEYIGEGYSEEYVKEILFDLRKLGAKNVVLTGVSLEKTKVGFALLEEGTDQVKYYFNDILDAKFHGTGDIFSSTALAGIMRGKTLFDALALAADFTRECIRITMPDREKHWYGVKFEEAIPYLAERLK